MNEFLTDLFGDQEGIVYAPVKGDKFKQHFFNWPQEREQLEAHLNDYNSREVYISPVLFNEPRIAPETFRGTNYLWTEFDGAVPTDVIEPTMRVLSSQEGHEHWYWKLDTFVTDKVLVEDLTRRIAYNYGADLSVWDYQNVLRPPDTWNHKRNKPVTLLNKNDQVYTVDKFLHVPIPPAGTKVSVSLTGLPTKEQILAKHQWTENAQDLLFKIVEKGHRSNALAALAHEAAESGCSNEEIYVLVEERDRAWGKFTGRTDRHRRLEGFIATVRSKRAIIHETLQDDTEVYHFQDFMKTNINLKWAIEGLLPVAGSILIEGKEGIGKSTFSLRMAMALALGDEDFLGWKIVNRQKTLFLSLEMQHAELKEFFNDMQLSDERREELQEWFYVWPIGHAYPLDTPDQQRQVLKYVDMHGIELIIVDSLSLAMYGSIKNDDDVKRLNSFMNEDLRKNRKCSYGFIHHFRKKGVGEEVRAADLDDSYGSRFITANAQTVIFLSQKKNSPKISVEFPKTRMALEKKEFFIERTPDRGFKLAGDTKPSSIRNEGGETPPKQKPNDGSLGKLLEF